MFRTASAIALFVLLALSLPARAEGLAERLIPANPQEPLPAFVFDDAKGQSLRLADFHGRAVLLNLWATWCGPCVAELPSLDRLQAALGTDHLAIIALDEERSASPDVTASFFKRHGIQNLPLYSDPAGRIAIQLHARGMPTSLLLDQNGQEIGRIEGGLDWSAPDNIAWIRQRLTSR